jgi:plasmid maintenance system antidote protein VapI
MKLTDYLEETGEKQTEFAARVGTTDATVSRLVAGNLRPGLDLALRIERATDGKVPPREWEPIEPKSEAA